MAFSQSPTLPSTTHGPSEVQTYQQGAPTVPHANVADVTNNVVMQTVTPASSTKVQATNVQVPSTGGHKVVSHTATITQGK